MKRGELWIATLDPKKGAEVGKQLPVLIVQTDLLNDVGHPTAIIAPISSQRQTENVLRFRIENASLHKETGYILIDQLRTIDTSLRLKKKIGKLKSAEIESIGELLKQVLDLS